MFTVSSFMHKTRPWLIFFPSKDGSEAGFNGGNDPENREPMWTSNYDTSSDMYKFFTSLNAARSAAGNASSTFYTDKVSIGCPLLWSLADVLVLDDSLSAL